MKYTLEQFKANVIQWSTDKLIIKHGNVKGQLNKVLEEADETIDAIIKCGISGKDFSEIMDGIGDTAVTLINIDAVQKCNTQFYISQFSNEDFKPRGQRDAIALMCFVKNWAKHTEEDYYYAWIALQEACWHLELDFMECCLMAWNEIKDRKGYFCEKSMSFVKES